jgi:tetratricopeptide (TPR) repeat protein
VALSGFAYPEANCDYVLLDGLETVAAHQSNYLSWLVVAGALLDLEQSEVAQAALQQCLRLQPDCPEAAYTGVRLALLQGNRAQAIAQLRDVLKANPRHPFANTTLARLYTEDGDLVSGAACLAARARVYGR